MDVSSSFSAEIGQRVVVEIDIGSRIAKSERTVGGARALAVRMHTAGVAVDRQVQRCRRGGAPQGQDGRVAY